MLFFSLRFCFYLSKIFQNNFNDVKITKFVSNVIHQIINRMFIVFFCFDSRFRKSEKRFSYFKFFFQNNLFHSKFRTNHFRFRFRFQSRF